MIDYKANGKPLQGNNSAIGIQIIGTVSPNCGDLKTIKTKRIL